ncbi:MAG TPA: phasin family protein [Rhodoblastus sp.]|mgnify:CR=1 FL=1|nr:phasin family protein [Rhodoblastus sp.]
MTDTKKTVRKPKTIDAQTVEAEAAETANKAIETAREYAHRAAEAVLERATSLHAGAEKATASIESTAIDSVESLAKASREIQNALLDDAKAAIAAFEKTVAAKSVGDAFRVQADYYRAQFDVNVSRAKTVGALVAQAAQDGVKRAQDNLAGLTAKFGKAA